VLRLTTFLCYFPHLTISVPKLTPQYFDFHFLASKRIPHCDPLCPNCTRQDDRTQGSCSTDVLSSCAFPFDSLRTTRLVDCGQRHPFLLRPATTSRWCIYTMDISLGRLTHEGTRGSRALTFLFQLLTVSALTVISLTTTIVLHCFTGLHPHSNMISNSILFLLWSVGFALFTWWSSGTLTHACNKRNWGSSIGIRICQYFKVLFTFTLLGL
jgi:hypothetical protein